MTPKRTLETQQDGAWKAAAEYANLLGSSVEVFPSCIRLLRSDSVYSQGTQALALRLLACPAVKVPFYYAAQALEKNSLENNIFISEKDLLSLFAPQEFSSILALVVFFNRLKRLADNKMLNAIVPAFETSLALGAHIGRALPQIGISKGLLIAGLKYISFGTFLVVDVQIFEDYCDYLSKNKIACDLEYERRTWGCTHAHVGTLLLLRLGFGVEDSYSYQLGISAKNTNTQDKDTLRVKVLTLWLNSLLSTGNPPESSLGDDYIIQEKDYDILSAEITKILKQGNCSPWISKTAKDLDAQRKIQLFGQPASNTQNDYGSLPETVRSAFNPEEWKTFHAEIESLFSA